MKKEKYYEKIEKFCQERGAGLFGVADISGIRNEFNLSVDEITGLDKAISIGCALSKKVLDTVVDQPTKLYYHHYRQANRFLDQVAFEVVNLLEQDGFNGLAIPASQILDSQKQTAHLSHKKIAQLAGIGWVGRNNLLVTAKYGAQIRLVTILTDAPLDVTECRGGSRPAPTCNVCCACISACPAGAIKENPQDFDHAACFEKIRELRKITFIQQNICGICVKVCKGK